MTKNETTETAEVEYDEALDLAAAYVDATMPKVVRYRRLRRFAGTVGVDVADLIEAIEERRELVAA